jgi:hypothetical protein
MHGGIMGFAPKCGDRIDQGFEDAKALTYDQRVCLEVERRVRENLAAQDAS